MKILITGGSGLLGGKVAEMAQARGDEVFAGYAHNAPGFGKAVKFDLLEAAMVLEAGERHLYGTYHLAGASRISRYDFARAVARMLDLDLSLISPSRMEDMNWIAKRPRDSSLDTSKAAKLLKEKPLSNEEAVQRLNDELAVL